MTNLDRCVVIISPYFPPSTVAGVHRARLLAKHLPACGWKPVVFSVHEREHEERLDPDLARLLPTDLHIIKCGALQSKLTRRFGIGDLSLRAYPSLRSELIRFLKTKRADVVMITGSPYYTFLLARVVKRRFRVPVVLDFQDPWVSNWGASLPKWSKGGLSHQLATWLEPVVVRYADHIVSVSEGQNVEFGSRYPWWDASRLSVIPIGGDAADFVYLRDHPLKISDVTLSPDLINLCYVGALLPRAGPVLQRLFAGVARLVRKQPWLAQYLRFNFIGTSNQRSGDVVYRVLPYAEEAEIIDLVTEVPHRVKYLEALNILSSSHGLLLIGSDEPHYTASKIYPALLSGRPMLGLFHRSSSACDILRRCGGARVVSFSDLRELKGKEEEIAIALADLVLRPESIGQASPKCIRPYCADRIAENFAEIFEAVTK